jgi:hypothetical protein
MLKIRFKKIIVRTPQKINLLKNRNSTDKNRTKISIIMDYPVLQN